MALGVEERLLERFPELGAEYGSPVLVLIGGGRVVRHPDADPKLLSGTNESSILSRARLALLRGGSQVDEIAGGHLFVHPIVSLLGEPVGAVCVAVARELPADRSPMPESQQALLRRYLELWVKDSLGDEAESASEPLLDLDDESAERALEERLGAVQRWVPVDDPMHDDPFDEPPPPPPQAIAEDAGEGSSGGEEGVEAPPDDLAAAGLNGVPADSEAAEEEPVAAQEREAAATSGGEAIEAAVGAGPRIAARTKIIPVVVPEARDAAPVVYSKAEDAPPETPPPPSIERTGVEREERDQPVATEGLAADTSETVQQTSASEATSAPIAPIAPTPEESAPEAAMADAPPSILVTVPYQLSAANEGASDLVGVERGTRGIPCYEFLGRRAPCRPCVAVAAHLQGSIATARVAGESGCDYLITSTQLVGSDPPRFIEQIEEAPALREPDPVADLPPWPPIDDAPADSEEVAPAAELGSGVEPFDEPTPEVTIEELDGFEDEDPPRPALDELAEAESYLLDEALPSAAPDGRPREPNASVETAPFRPIEAPAGPRHPWLRNVMAGLLGAALIAFGYRWATQGEEAPVLPPGAIELDLPPELVAELESRTDAWNRPGAIALDSVGVAVPTAEPRQAPDTPPATPPDAGPEAIVEEPPVAAADPDPQTPDTEADPPPVLAESGAAQPVGPRIDSPFANWVAYEVALEFLERGDLSGAADAWDAMLESEPKSNSTLMLETNCEEWAAKENLKRFTGDTAAILKPIYIEGRKCFLLAYGSFANEAEANAAIDRLPEPFRSRSTRPIIRSFNLLP